MENTLSCGQEGRKCGSLGARVKKGVKAARSLSSVVTVERGAGNSTTISQVVTV
jgi:hypothetical protein